MITACGGTSEIVHETVFMVGQGLQVVALFDSDADGKAQEEKLRKGWLTRYKEKKSATLLLGKAVGSTHETFTIEDMFPEAYYLEKVKGSHLKNLQDVGKSAEDLQLHGTGPVLARMEQACKNVGISFNKGAIAKLVRKDLLQFKSCRELPEGTEEKAQRLFEEIRKTLGSP